MDAFFKHFKYVCPCNTSYATEQKINKISIILLVIDIESLKLSLAPFCSFWFVKISHVFSLKIKYEKLNEAKECFNCIILIFHVLFNACWD